MNHADLRERVLEANLAIVSAGLVIMTFGNVSAVNRDAGVMAIKPSGVPYDRLRPQDIVVVDLETGCSVDTTLRPSSDTPTHLVLYREFERIGGVVHTHSSHATAWAQACTAIPCLGTTHADHFEGPVPVTRGLSSDELRGEYEVATGYAIVETIIISGREPLHMPAVLVASHGPFAWGADAATAVENAVALEAIAASALRALQIRPGLTGIDPELRDKHFSRKHGAGAYYGQAA